MALALALPLELPHDVASAGSSLAHSMLDCKRSVRRTSKSPCACEPRVKLAFIFMSLLALSIGNGHNKASVFPTTGACRDR